MSRARVLADYVSSGDELALKAPLASPTFTGNIAMPDDSIDLAHMNANSVDSDQYVDGSIDLVHMSANSVDSDQYVDGSIDLIHMSANSVDSDQYVDGSIDSDHIANDQIDSQHYAAASIDNEHLADDAVGSDELANDVVINTSGAITTTGAFTSVGIDDNADATTIIIDDQECVGIGGTPPNYYSSFQCLQVGNPAYSGTITIHGRTGDYAPAITKNAYFAQTGITYRTVDAGYACALEMGDGTFTFNNSGTSSRSADEAFTNTRLVTFANDASVGIGNNDPSAALHVTRVAQTHCATFTYAHTEQMIYLDNNSTGMTERLLAMQTQTEDTGSTGSGFEFIRCRGASNDEEFKVLGNGAILHDGSITSNQGDYAEYFESVDGSAIPVGTSVVLENGKVKVAESGESPIGVVRPVGTSSVIGNSAWNKWDSKYMRDDYGQYLREDYTSTEWGEGEDKKMYHTDRIPDDVEVPEDAEVVSQFKDGRNYSRKKLNPDFDPDLEYVPRSERDEWNLIGLLGQVPIAKDQPVAASWIKMRDVSDTVEMWFIK